MKNKEEIKLLFDALFCFAEKEIFTIDRKKWVNDFLPELNELFEEANK